MLTIRLLVNGETIDEIEVLNRGPVGGNDGQSYDADDYAGGGCTGGASPTARSSSSSTASCTTTATTEPVSSQRSCSRRSVTARVVRAGDRWCQTCELPERSRRAHIPAD